MVKPGWNEVPSMRKNVRVLEVRFQNFRNLVIEMAIAKAGNVLRRWFGGKHVSVRAVCCSSGPILPTVVVLPAPFVSLACHYQFTLRQFHSVTATALLVLLV